jgi:hypothetical protein
MLAEVACPGGMSPSAGAVAEQHGHRRGLVVGEDRVEVAVAVQAASAGSDGSRPATAVTRSRCRHDPKLTE